MTQVKSVKNEISSALCTLSKIERMFNCVDQSADTTALEQAITHFALLNYIAMRDATRSLDEATAAKYLIFKEDRLIA